MKKIKIYLLAALAIFTSVSFTACSDDDSNTSSNWDTNQSACDNAVKSQKKSNKAILLVAFGSTWENAFAAFDNTQDAYKEAYPDYDVYFSYSSNICINRAAAGEHEVKRDYYSPENWLEAFGRVQYDTIVVQSLQVIPGEEYSNVIGFIKAFGNNKLRDLDDTYLSNVKVFLGTPLMATTDDAGKLAKELNTKFAANAANGAVFFMGHGNPNDYDTYSANVRYSQLEDSLHKYSINYYVGTVDMPGNYKTQVRQRMKANGITSGTFYLQALMSIAGDHAHNDMAGDDFSQEQFNADSDTYTGEVEETSWKEYFKKYGFTFNATNAAGSSLIGLLEIPSVLQLWMNHTADAIAGEPMEIYHSMNPE